MRKTVTVDIELYDICNIDLLKKVIGHSLTADMPEVRRAAQALRDELMLDLATEDFEPQCDAAYRKWLNDRRSGG